MLHTKIIKDYHNLIKLSSNAFCRMAKDQLLPYITGCIFGNIPKRIYSFALPINWVIDTKWLVKFQLMLLYEYEIDSTIFCADLNGKTPTWRITIKPCELSISEKSALNQREFISSNTKLIDKLNEYYLRKFQEHVSFR